MPTRIDWGEVAERTRRVLRLVGRINTRVDETVTLVAQLDNLAQDPYRAEPRTFSMNVAKAAVAAVNSLVGIQAAPVKPGVFPGELLVIDRITMAFPAGVAGTDQFFVGLARLGFNVTLFAGFAFVNFVPVLNSPGRGGGVPQVLSSQVFAAAPAVTGGVQFAILDCAGPGVTQLYEGELSQPVVIYPGESLLISSIVQNKAINVNFIGRAYDPTFLNR